MYSPTKLLAISIAAIFAVELLIMSALPLLAPLPWWLENTLDAFLLVILLFPILYFQVFKPLRTLNVELEERTRDAESASRAKSTFMANISHEIRTPLHVLIGISHLLRRAPDNPVQLQRLDQLCATSEHLLVLVNDILDLSKIEAGRFVLDDSVFRLGNVIDQVLEVMTQLAREKNLALTTDIAPAVHDVALHGDHLRLSQILINLGGNAVKFSDHGAICLGVGVCEEDDERVRLCFTVQDSGIGIAPEDQARIFQPFEQLDSSITREYGGTGLGLAISQRLVSLMGGTIRVDSQPGVGSTFSFEVVFRRGTGITETTNTIATEPDLAGIRILVAEDHPLSQEIILEMLEDLGCHADIAADGLEAVECALKHSYDLILMDMQMPKMDGLAATRAIRELPQHSDMPIVALTANAFVEDRQRCCEAGMNDYLSKPVTSAKLVSTLSHWLPDLAFHEGANQVGDSELSIALAKIPGLDVAQSWRRSMVRLNHYLALLDKFVKLHAGDMELLREHLAAGEISAADTLAHNLKGISGLIGARQVEVLAAELVQALRSGSNQAKISALAVACESELARLTESVRTLPLRFADAAGA